MASLADYQILELVEGLDLTEILNIQKWEAPEPAHLSGSARGNFPSFIQKTDQERVQNCFNKMVALSQEHDLEWVVEEKLDGSSCTDFVYFNSTDDPEEHDYGICSRNMNLKVDENSENTFVKTVLADRYLEHLHKLGRSLAIQGELCGPGIQGNKYNLEKYVFYVFDIYDIDKRCHLTISDRWDILKQLLMLGVTVNQVPHIGTTVIPETVNDCLKMAEGKSKLNPKQEREGLVFKSTKVVNGYVPSFKAISNKFLLGEK